MLSIMLLSYCTCSLFLDVVFLFLFATALVNVKFCCGNILIILLELHCYSIFYFLHFNWIHALLLQFGANKHIKHIFYLKCILFLNAFTCFENTGAKCIENSFLFSCLSFAAWLKYYDYIWKCMYDNAIFTRAVIYLKP